MWKKFATFSIFFLFARLHQGTPQDLPSLYEYFATNPDGGTTGLVAEADGFKLNGRPIRLISGAMHYFRIHPDLWRDRLRKLRATGANTVETYVAWTLHEPVKDEWDFGEGNNDMSTFLNLTRYIEMAQEEDLLVLLRPGPYICSEFEFGGMPSYLLRDANMSVRTSYPPFLARVKVYLDQLLPKVTHLQFTKGGPIIALQIENEYASFDTIHAAYLEFIRDAYLEHGIESLLFTSDGSWNGEIGSLPGVLKTANFMGDARTNLNDLLSFQPDKPVMVMELWAGWFDHWFESHSTTDVDELAKELDIIYGEYNGSVNYYMFHGGTNFGFMAGANVNNDLPNYQPDITSYDYDAPLSEAGDYTAKYYKVMEMCTKYSIPILRRPLLPPVGSKAAYPTARPSGYLTFQDILDQVPLTSKFQMQHRVSMEMLPMNNGGGQSQGYILYRKTNVSFASGSVFKAGRVRDFGILMVNGEIQPFPKDENGTTQYWLNSAQEYQLQVSDQGPHTLDLLIENKGRVNFGRLQHFEQHKGLRGTALAPNESYHLNGVEIADIEIVALEFKSAWVKNVTNWRTPSTEEVKAPALFQFTFTVAETPRDTFIDMSRWGKGIVFINGFNLGRYFNAGPQQTLYLPRPFLKQGENIIIVFEQLQPSDEVTFRATPDLGPTSLTIAQTVQNGLFYGGEMLDTLMDFF